jgi:hypothetical protein
VRAGDAGFAPLYATVPSCRSSDRRNIVAIRRANLLRSGTAALCRASHSSAFTIRLPNSAAAACSRRDRTSAVSGRPDAGNIKWFRFM